MTDEKNGNEKDVLQDWLKTQEKLLETWKDSVTSFQPESVKNTFGEPFEKMLEEWQNNQEKVLELWKGTFSDFSPDKMFNPFDSDVTKKINDFYENWYENYNKMFNDMTKMFPSQVGKETFEKMFQGGQAYSNLFDFWNNYVSGLVQMPNSSLPENFSEMPKEWMEEYNKVLRSFFQQGLGEPFNDFIKSTSELADAYKQTMESFIGPWMESSDELKEKAMEAMKGDKEAYMEFLKGWNEAFHESYGRLFKTSGFGLTKEQSEKLLQSIDAYTEYTTAVNEFTASLYKVGYDVMDKIMNRIIEQKEKGEAPETFKEFYDMWISANEESFLELFKEDSFAKLLGRVVDSGATFKKKYDEVMIEGLKDLPIPTDEEMDTVYKNMHELKKEVREQKKEIEELKKKLDEK